MEPLQIQRVDSAAGLKAFIRVPWSIYSGDPNWVPPLIYERRHHLSPAANPFFGEAEVSYWLAIRGSRYAGRISAQVNKAHLHRHGDATGHFGFLEAEDSAETFAALFAAATAWLRQRGLLRIRGPFSLSINDEAGLLIEGFDTRPSIMMGHARPYYAERVEEQGFVKAKDLICYHYDLSLDLPPFALSVVKKAKQSNKVQVRSVNMARFEEELHCLMDIFNDAWSENWGFVPFSLPEIRYLAKNLRPLVQGEFIAIAEFDGEPAAMAVSLPNLNEAIADLDGRLLPLGWAKLLWRIRVRSTKTVRVALMGVRKKFQSGPIGAMLAYSVINAIRCYHRGRGVKGAELSWILEDNRTMHRLLQQLGGRPYKTYRIYERDLL